MANKITKRDRFNQLLTIEEISTNKGLVEFINHELELLEKKNGSGKMTKGQIENEKIKESVAEVLFNHGKAIQIKDLQNLSGMENYSNQKLSALLRQMVKDGMVVRTEEKKVAYFSIA